MQFTEADFESTLPTIARLTRTRAYLTRSVTVAARIMILTFALGVHHTGFDKALADPSSTGTELKRVESAGLTGRIETHDNIRVLTVWGGSRERGYAHGYLLADEIVNLLDGYLRHSVADPVKFEKQAAMLVKVMTILPRYQQELSGMLEGIQAKLGEDVQLSTLKRRLRLEDLIAMVCIPEMARIGCSSFAAWGSMTADGETIAGRNLDWFAIPVLDGRQIIIVNGADGDALGWVSITWPGFIGCLTGMNSEGVTVSMHDVYTGRPTAPLPFTPRAMALREAIETAHAETAIEDVQRVLRRRFAMVGNNVPISFPYKAGMPTAAAVFEYDSQVTNGFGVTRRLNDGGASTGGSSSLDGPVTKKKKGGEARQRDYLLCTNHYRTRGEAEGCDRYSELQVGCENITGASAKLTVELGWKLLRDVACAPDSRIRTYQSVIFEPNERRMHVALSIGGKPATEGDRVTVDVRELLRTAGK